eukprot:TRINITY_DN4948_c0_g1_i1.p1 TRINITY_DN4948_c0_g1~~TRINITY_DN4948_c0_g1_i1.p1  ORF type:complete len:161 (+),score=49.74 TRINITY_DN4948_c0_g1_i1:101-583(+)
MNHVELLLIVLCGFVIAYFDSQWKEESRERESILISELDLQKRFLDDERKKYDDLERERKKEVEELELKIQVAKAEHQSEREKRLQIEEKYKEQREKWKVIWKESQDCENRVKEEVEKTVRATELQKLQTERELAFLKERYAKLQQDYAAISKDSAPSQG